jgi:hypothetical protein
MCTTLDEPRVRDLIRPVSPLSRLFTRLTDAKEAAHSPLPDTQVAKAAALLNSQGVFTPAHVAERAMRGADPAREGEILGLTPEQTTELFRTAVQSLPEDERAAIARLVELPRPTGGLNPSDHDFEERRQRLDAIPVTTKEHLDMVATQRLNPFLPLGPLHAVDHRTCLGAVRSQDGPTCAAFGSTVVPEALEYLRDRRGGPIDLSEELCWWLSKGGQSISGAQGDAVTMLGSYVYFGGCEEWLHPFKSPHILNNWAHVPVPDEVIDRARLYKQAPFAGGNGQFLRLPDNDVNAVKTVLDSGRCVVIDVNASGFDCIHGMIAYPNANTQAHNGRSGHLVAIIGYIERPDIDSKWEGGCFIVRNSWGPWTDHGHSFHYLGPDYAGHLIMPFAWFKKYTSYCCTLGDLSEKYGLPMTTWAAQFYGNRSLAGNPAFTGEAGRDLNYDWHGNSPAAGVAGQDFSARFSQLRRFRPGWHQFKLTGDDGIRLWVDDKLVINAWKDQGPTTCTKEHYVQGGDHTLRVEYYQAAGGSCVRLDVLPVNFHYELFANADLSGQPAAVFDDTSTEQEWRHTAPVGGDGIFSARVTAQKSFAAGTYRFHSRHTGSCTIRLDGGGTVLSDIDGTHPDGNPVTLAAGTYRGSSRPGNPSQ